MKMATKIDGPFAEEVNIMDGTHWKPRNTDRKLRKRAWMETGNLLSTVDLDTKENTAFSSHMHALFPSLIPR
jgi:hypothetical protein